MQKVQAVVLDRSASCRNVTRQRFRRCVLTVVVLTAACGSPPEEVEARGSAGTVTPRYVGEVFPIHRGDRVLLLVNRTDAVDVVEFDGETIAERASISLEGYVLTVAGALSTDGSTLDVVADTCPDGLSGVDPDWPLECSGESASIRVSVDTGSWQAGEPRTVGPGLSFSPDAVSLLEGDLLVALGGIGARSVRLTAAGDVVLPVGCAVGDIIYNLVEVLEPGLEPDNTVVSEAAPLPPPGFIERFDRLGVRLPALEPPAGSSTGASTLGEIMCTSEAVYYLDLSGGPDQSDYSELFRLDGSDWRSTGWSGDLPTFMAGSSTTGFLSLRAFDPSLNSDYNVSIIFFDSDGFIYDEQRDPDSVTPRMIEVNGRRFILRGTAAGGGSPVIEEIGS